MLGHLQLLELPSEILYLILLSLDENDLARLGSCCHILRIQCSDPRLWKILWIRKWSFLKTIVESSGKFEECKMDKYQFGKTMKGELKFWVSIHNRESTANFLLSCYNATVTYLSKSKCFEAVYWEQNEISKVAERIPISDAKLKIRGIPLHRIEDPSIQQKRDHTLQPGEPIEVQWRKFNGHPWGWWYGKVGVIDDTFCQLIFPLYEPGSFWYTVVVDLEQGTPQIVSYSGGFIGGVRRVENEHKEQWKYWEVVSKLQIKQVFSGP